MTIFVTFDPEAGWYELMVSDGKMSPMPAGARLFRPPMLKSFKAPPIPDMKFQHDTMDGAQRDAGVLRRYLDNFSPRKLSKKEIQQYGE